MISLPKIWEIFTSKFSVFMQGVGTTVELALYLFAAHLCWYRC